MLIVDYFLEEIQKDVWGMNEERKVTGGMRRRCSMFVTSGRRCQQHVLFISLQESSFCVHSSRKIIHHNSQTNRQRCFHANFRLKLHDRRLITVEHLDKSSVHWGQSITNIATRWRRNDRPKQRSSKIELLGIPGMSWCSVFRDERFWDISIYFTQNCL